MLTADDLKQIGDIVSQILADSKPDDIPLTRQQAAYYLGVSLCTIDNYRKRGLIKLSTRGTLVGYLKKDLNKIKV